MSESGHCNLFKTFGVGGGILACCIHIIILIWNSLLVDVLSPYLPWDDDPPSLSYVHQVSFFSLLTSKPEHHSPSVLRSLYQQLIVMHSQIYRPWNTSYVSHHLLFQWAVDHNCWPCRRLTPQDLIDGVIKLPCLPISTSLIVTVLYLFVLSLQLLNFVPALHSTRVIPRFSHRRYVLVSCTAFQEDLYFFISPQLNKLKHLLIAPRGCHC